MNSAVLVWFRSLLLAGFLLAAAPSELVAGGGGELDPPCVEGLATVTVKTETSGGFHYTIHNQHTHPARIFIIGRAQRDEMLSIDENIPLSVASPEGWKGSAFPLHESLYMQVFWDANTRKHAVPGGQELAGFSVVMPPQEKQKKLLLGPDGQPSVPLDMARAPFQIHFTDGTCTWGRVEQDQFEGSTPPENSGQGKGHETES